MQPDRETESPPPRPTAGAVRALVLEEHRNIRAHLLKVHGLVPAAARGVPGVFEELVRSGAELVEVFQRHLEMEDELLVPTLEAIDAWGPVRREQLAEEHERQRGELVAFAARLRAATRFDPSLVVALDVLVAELLADMEEEERDVLDKDLLRDDVIAIDSFGG